MGDLGDPSTATAYGLCIYDYRAVAPTLVTSLMLDPDESWHNAGLRGWRYRNRLGDNDGIKVLALKAGRQEKSRARVRARGARIPMPAPLTDIQLFARDGKVTVQLIARSDEGPSTCWTSDFAMADTGINTATRFEATNP